MNKSIVYILSKNFDYKKYLRAFTIIELMVVIVVIGILAAITIVSYSGITNRAVTVSIKSQLAEDSKVLKMYYVDHGLYPSTLDANYCPLTPVTDNRHCLRNMDGATLTYSGTNNSFTLTIEKNNISYNITETGDIARSTPSNSAESFVLAWGGNSVDYALDLVKTSDGGYATVGNVNSYGAGIQDVFLAKYDKNGNLSWNKTWGGTGYDFAKTLTQTIDGGYIIAGKSNSYNAGNQDAFIAKFDQSGILSWSKTWGGGTGSDDVWSIIQTSDAGYVIAGYTDSFGVGSNDAFLVKYDQNGNLLWNKTWGGTGDDDFYSIIKTSDGGFAMVGNTGSFGAGSNDAFLVKYDQNGNRLWNKTWGGTGDDYAGSLAQTTDGGYVIAGRAYSYGAGDADAFFVKYDQSGNLLWNKTWGGTNYDEITSIIQTQDDGYVASGYTYSYGAGDADVFIVKYDQSGNLLWNKTWGGTGYDDVYGLAQVSNGYITTGGTDNYGAGNSDAVVIKYKLDGGIIGCSAPMCQSPTAFVSSPTAVISSPTASESSPLATVMSPSATVTSPMATSTVIVAPL